MPLGNPIRKQNESRIISVLATEGQSVFTVEGGYIINQISVFRNGVRLSNSEDFTAGDGSTVTLNNEANVDDRIEFHIFDKFTVQNAIVGAASSQTISGDLVVNGKLFGNLDVPSINTGIVTATQLDLNGSLDVSSTSVFNDDVTFTGAAANITFDKSVDDLIFNDNAKAAFGTSSDLIIFHDGTLSKIQNSSSGQLEIVSNDIDLRASTGDSQYFTAQVGGAATVFYGNSVRITTSPSGADVTGTLNVTGISTVQALQATTGTFSSDVSAATVTSTGTVTIPDKIVHTGDTDTAIRFPAADTFTIETGGTERARVDSGGDIGINITDPTAKLHIVEAASIPAIKIKQGLDSNQNSSLTFFNDNDGGTLALGVFGSSATTFGANEANDAFVSANNQLALIAQNNSGQIRFGVGSTPNTKMLLDSSGRLLIGTTTEGHSSADDLTIATSGTTGITIRSGTSNAGNIYFSDATSGTAEYAGYVSYSHSTNALSFGTNNGTERLTIGSNGLVTITAETYSALTINTANDGPNGPEIDLMHTSTSPVAGDVVGQLRYNGKDSAGNTTLYSKIETKVDDPTNGQETANIDFSTRGLGAYNSIFRLKNRGTASAPSYTTDDMNGIILDTYNGGGGGGYPRYMSLIAKSAGDTESNILFWTESVGGSPTEKVRITSKGTLYSGGTIPSDLATYSSSLRGREGVFGPIFYWPRSYGTHSNGSGYDNVAEGGRLTLRMHGAQGGTAAMFQGGFGFGYGSGGEAKNYNRLRVFFRVTRSGNSYTTANVTFKLQSYYYTSGWADISNSNWDFNGTDSERGYRWTSSNWISTSDLQGGTDVPSIAIKYDNDNGNTGNADMRIAAVYFQYAYFN